MRRFDLVEPTTLEEVCGLIASNNAKVIAGGVGQGESLEERRLPFRDVRLQISNGKFEI
jgi:CO/xanthine dehydrogenase FAD-binding subunit